MSVAPLSDRAMGRIAWPMCIDPNAALVDALAHVAEHHADECLVWTGTRHDCGYGLIGADNRSVYMHRYVLGLMDRAPEPDECALHHCDNPPCVNPAHLRWGTKKDNLQDALSRGRFPVEAQRSPGSRNGQSKLTEADALDVRHRLARGEGLTAIARIYNVTPGVISHIKHGRSWRHVQIEVAS